MKDSLLETLAHFCVCKTATMSCFSQLVFMFELTKDMTVDFYMPPLSVYFLRGKGSVTDIAYKHFREKNCLAMYATWVIVRTSHELIT